MSESFPRRPHLVRFWEKQRDEDTAPSEMVPFGGARIDGMFEAPDKDPA